MIKKLRNKMIKKSKDKEMSIGEWVKEKGKSLMRKKGEKDYGLENKEENDDSTRRSNTNSAD